MFSEAERVKIEAGCGTQTPAVLLTPVPGTGVCMVPFPALLSPSRTHFGAVRFSFATSTLRTEVLL